MHGEATDIGRGTATHRPPRTGHGLLDDPKPQEFEHGNEWNPGATQAWRCSVASVERESDLQNRDQTATYLQRHHALLVVHRRFRFGSDSNFLRSHPVSKWLRGPKLVSASRRW